MFVTASIFAVPEVARLMKPGQAVWSAVGLTTRLAWFILTVQQEEAGDMIWTDILMSDAREIGAMLESPSPPTVVSIHMLSVDPLDRSSWQCRVAHQVWRGTDKRTGRPTVFFADEAGEFWQEHAEVCRSDITNCTILASFRPEHST